MFTKQTLWPDDGCVERIIALFEAVTEANCTGYTRVNDYLLLHFKERDSAPNVCCDCGDRAIECDCCEKCRACCDCGGCS